MHSIVLNAHRGFGYLIIVLVVLFVVGLVSVLLGNSGKINKLLRKSSMFTMIFFHIQFLVGAIMLIGTSPFLEIIKTQGMGTLMKNADLRFTYIEHPFSMLLAAILMTVANKKIKTAERMSVGILVLAVIALLLFGYAFPFDKLFNK